MRKIIALSFLLPAALALSSCGGPKGDQTYEQVTAGHVDAVFANIERAGLPKEIVKFVQEGSVRVALSSAKAQGALALWGTGRADLSASGGMAQQTDLSIEASGSTDGKSSSGSASFSAFTSGSDSYFKLLKLAVASEDSPQVGLIADMAKGPLLDKWVKLPTAAEAWLGQKDPFAELRSKISRDPRGAMLAIRDAVKNNFPFEKTADLGFKDGTYSYAVSYSGAKLAKAVRDAYAQLAGTGAEPLPQDLEMSFGKMTGTGTLTVDEADKSRFSADMTFRNETGSGVRIAVANGQRGLKLDANPTEGSGSFSFSVGADGKDGKIAFVTEEGKKAVTGTFAVDARRGSQKFTGTLNVEPDAAQDAVVVTFDAAMTWKQDASIKLAAPTDAIPFAQVFGGLMGPALGGGLPTDPSFDPTDDTGAAYIEDDGDATDTGTEDELQTLLGKDAKIVPQPAAAAAPAPLPRPRLQR